MADVSGAWLGTYWQNGTPTRFEVTLVQGGNRLQGQVLDGGYLGEAHLSGEVIGRRIQFQKRYLTHGDYTIEYAGTLSDDGDHMAGQWHIDRRHHGPWEAHRSDDDLSLSLRTTLAQNQPQPVGLAGGASASA